MGDVTEEEEGSVQEGTAEDKVVSQFMNQHPLE